MPIDTSILAAYQFNFDWFAEAWPKLVAGLVVTVEITILVMLLSVPLGFGVAFARLGRIAPP